MQTTTPVPFLDLSPVNMALKERLLEEIGDLVETGAFTNGPQVAQFEQAFAEYCDRRYCVGVANGLDALRLRLVAARLEEGDEVIVPAMTFIATVEAVVQAGGTPVLVDITNDDYCVDVDAVEAALTERTRFVLPVHLYGQLADMRRLCELAESHGFEILEDACQAHGATRDGIRAGAAGGAGAFSFYPGKNLSAMGDAGALVTDDEDLAAEMRALREHGQTRKYHHDYVGYTSRLDTIQAIALLAKLPLLDEGNDERRAVAEAYSRALEGVGDLKLPATAPESDPVWHLYVVRTADPGRLAASLRERGIGTGRHYPEPLHFAPPFSHLGQGPGTFPVAEALARECLSLPIFPGMTPDQVDAVTAALATAFAERG